MTSKKELLERIERLESQVLEDKTVRWYLYGSLEKPTLKSKIDAIIKHLGVEVVIKKSTEEVIARKVKK